MHDLELYAILIAEHEAMLHAYVLGLVRDANLADDICQETFVQAYRQLSTLRDKAAFAAWLRGIARNLAYAELRRLHREEPTDPVVLQGMEEVFGALDRNPRGQTWQERAQTLAVCLDRLPEVMRSAFELHYLERKTAAEVARLLSVSLHAVLKRLQRARESLANCIERQLGLDPP